MSRPRRITDPGIAAFAEQRHVILARTARLLNADRDKVPFIEQHDALPETAALLTATIEMLKVAEEALVQQNEELRESREAVESTSRHYKELFDLTPVGVLVTDLWGTIHEANVRAGGVLRREPTYLVGKPLTVFVPVDDRDEFRTRITRLATLDGIHEWHARLAPHGDVPITVRLTTRVARGPHREDCRVLWVIRTESTAGTAPVVAHGSPSTLAATPALGSQAVN